MSASRLDAVYRSILITKFFTKGWGKPENLKRLFEFRKVVSNRDECFKLVERDYPVTITKEEKLSDCHLLEGYFLTPLDRFLPGIVPEMVRKAHFQVVLPNQWPDSRCKPMCLHLAGTGDHFFWRRRNLMLKPLLKEAGIGGIILENPFYGLRKPVDQVRSSLHNVSDIFVMGGCLILESLVLFHWCERNGLGPLGVTGLSMGGHMASLAATNWPKPLVLVPCLSWSTASAVFLQGVMSQSINWDLLEDQFLSDGVYREKLSKMVTIVDEAFLAGKKFAHTYSKRMENIEQENISRQAESENVTKNVETEKQNEKLDITYNESNGAKNDKAQENGGENLNVTKSDKVPKVEQPVGSVEIEKLNQELKRLLEEGKVNKALYEKLTSNERFELQAQEIDEINKLTEEQLKDFLLNCKVAELRAPHKETQSMEPKEILAEIPQTKTEITIKPPADVENDIRNINESKEETNTENKAVETKNKAVETENKAVETENNAAETKNQDESKRRSWNVTDITSDIWTNLPFIKTKSGKKIDISKIHWRDREALQFMRGIMDECTHLSNFSVPYDTSLIIAVCAKHDAYVPRDDVGTLEEIWPGAEVRYVDAGHVSAYILHQSMFRSCIIEAFERSKKRWKDGKHIN